MRPFLDTTAPHLYWMVFFDGLGCARRGGSSGGPVLFVKGSDGLYSSDEVTYIKILRLSSRDGLTT